MQKTSILLVGPHLLFKQSLSYMLNATRHLEVVGEADSMMKAAILLSELAPQLVILDTDLKGMNRFELIKFIKACENEVNVLLLTSGNFSSQARQIVNTGARGYLSKYSTSKELIEALSEIIKGKMYFDKKIKNEILEVPS